LAFFTGFAEFAFARERRTYADILFETTDGALGSATSVVVKDRTGSRFDTIYARTPRGPSSHLTVHRAARRSTNLIIRGDNAHFKGGAVLESKRSGVAGNSSMTSSSI